MIVSIPLTGTLIAYNPVKGDPDDPVRPIPLKMGNCRRSLISLDLENDLALIDVTPADQGDFESGGVISRRSYTEQEKEAMLANIKNLLLDNSIDRLYQITGSARLRKPKK